MVFYYKDKVCYAFPNIYSIEKGNNFLEMRTEYSVFICNKGESNGYYFNSVKSDTCTVEPIDSLLTLKAFGNFNFFDINNDSLVYSSIAGGDFEIIEKYIPKLKPDASYCDTTIILYSRKFKNSDYTFSRSLDSLRKIKASKIRIIYNSQSYPGYDVTIPPREFTFAFKNVSESEVNEVTAFIKRFNILNLSKRNNNYS